jgi:hypothetical protein
VTVYQHSKAQRGTAVNVVVVVVVGGGERMGSPIERESTWVMTRHDDSRLVFDVVAKTGRRKFSKF